MKDEPCGITPRRPRTALKVLLILFFDRSGVVHNEFLQETVTANVYIHVLRHFLASLQRVIRSELS